MTTTIASDVDELLSIGMAILNFVADNPGIVGRLRAARILTGGITEEDIDRGLSFDPGTVIHSLPAITVVAVIDSMIESGRVAKTWGDRPRLVLTREGFGLLAAIGSVRP